MKSKYLIYLIFILVVFAASYLKLTSFYEGNIRKVIDSAEEIAANEPYCIQVNGGNDYKEALALSDFSGKNMRGSELGNYHAILVIGDVYKPKLLNWSYRKESFLPNVYGVPAIYCSPRPHFAKILPKTSDVAPEKINFVYSGMKFSIPKLALPSSTGVDGFVFRDFNHEISPDELSISLVEVNFRLTDRMQIWLYRKSNPNYIVEKDNDKFGLKKQSAWYFGSGERKKKPNDPGSIQYYLESETGVISTLIDCPNDSRGECNHEFHRDGWTYTFRHKPSRATEWKELEDRVVKLTRSYIVEKQQANRL